jgi:NAD+--dinitrogen-reductase ADP-D-ribosyltransferase
MGVRRANKFLFQRLDEIESAEDRAVFFNDYMSVKFQLHQWQEQATDKARKSIKNSYLRFLRGWGMESIHRRRSPERLGGESHRFIADLSSERIPGMHSEEYYRFNRSDEREQRTTPLTPSLICSMNIPSSNWAKGFPENAG